MAEAEREAEEKLKLRASGAQQEPAAEAEAEAEAEEAAEKEGGEAAAAQKPPSLTDAIPAAYRPLAMGGILAGTLYMLASKVAELNKLLVAPRVADLPEGVALKGNPQQRLEVVNAALVAAFEDAGVRRDTYLKTLAAALSAVGSMQGFLRFFQSDEKPAAGTVWLRSPLAARLAGFNGHMVWYVVSALLGFAGHHDKAAVRARPASRAIDTRWDRAGRGGARAWRWVLGIGDRLNPKAKFSTLLRPRLPRRHAGGARAVRGRR